jgi:hypothetical protein
MRSGFILIVLVGLGTLSMGQSTPASTPNPTEARTTPAAAVSSPLGMDSQVPQEDSSSDVPRIPAILGGPRTSLDFISEMERSNYLRAGLNVGAAYDDNALLSSSNGVGNTTFSVYPDIALEQTMSRMHWKIGYAGGLTVNQRFSSRNQGSHTFSFDSQYRLSPHVNLRIAEDFSLTSGFFDAGGTVTGGGNGTPNATVITPLAKQRASSTVVETNYHFALKDVVGASGSFFDLHFSDAQAQSNLTNARSETASAFWLHRLFRDDWAGLSYRFERLTFDPNGESNVHSFMVMNTLAFAKRFTLAAYAGPEYSDNRGLAPGSEEFLQFTNWSLAAGAEAGWQKNHTSIAAGYSRRINDGGGVLGVVRAQSVHGDLRQQLFPGWAATVGASYGSNKSLTVPFPGTPASLNITSIGATLERNVGKSLSARVSYYHDYQREPGSTQNDKAHRDRVSITLGYQWSRPFGQ